MPFNVAYAALVASALLASLFAPKNDRGPAFVSGLAVLGGWVLFVASWTDYAPTRVLTNFSYTDIWAMTDLAISSLILVVAGSQWWGKVLWFLFAVQMMMHVCYQYLGLNFAAYSVTLDALFLGQLSVFFMLGGGKIVDLLSHGYDHVRDVFGSPRAASATSKKTS